MRSANRSLLAHPVAVIAVVVLVINDHVLKQAMPGLLTGKLSDVAGLVFFPLLLAEALVAVSRLAPRHAVRRSMHLVLASATATGIAFALVKTTTVGGIVFSWTWGAAQWVAMLGPLSGAPIRPVATVPDTMDLLALPALLGAAWIAGRWTGPV
ncbi:MAG: hypothetical protein A2V85_00680, partial [Chloroflexi bacterium RBG_16_72_14]